MTEWKQFAGEIPTEDLEALKARIEAMYGPQNKGRLRQFYAVAVRVLLALDDKMIRQLVHRLEGEAHGPDVSPESESHRAARKLRAAAQRTLGARAGKKRAAR